METRINYNNELRQKYLRNFECKQASFGFVIGSPYTFLYIIDGVLFDTSVSAWANLLCEKLKNIQWKKVVFLTHSHYDHLGGVYTIKQFFDNIKVYGHSYISKILSSNTAINIIKEFNQLDSQEILNFHEVSDFGFDIFEIDYPIYFDQSEIVKLENIEVIFSPGHTKDTVSYYIPQHKALIMSESMGIPNYRFNFILPEFLSSYKLYIQSFEKLKRVVLENNVSNFLLPHIMYLEYFSDVKDFIKLSEESLNLYVKKIVEYIEKIGLKEELDVKIRDVFEMVVDNFYIRYELSQPLYGFEANVKAQIRTILRELL